MAGRSPSTGIAPIGTASLLNRREAMARIGMLGLAVSTSGMLLSACHTASKNVLLIIADDMRYDHMHFMPNVQRLIADPGRSFTQARCNVPLCQPNRVGLYTGQTSKHTNELGIGYGGTVLSDHSNLLGRWMNDAGYRCGLFGKYINGVDTWGGMDAPQGYSAWHELLRELSAEEFDVHRNTSIEQITGRYLTDYLADQAVQFMQSGHPFLCVVTPSQPHSPFWPRADLADEWLDLHWDVIDEVDVSDKPPWIQALPPLTDPNKEAIRANVIGALQELSAVDDMVQRIITGIGPALLADTVVIFTSDNGVHHGEHRRLGPATKSGPYEVGLHVPVIIRGPGITPGPPIAAPVLAFQDVAATILDVGDATAGRPNQAGTSLFQIYANASAYSERMLLHEIAEGFLSQTGNGITTGPESSRGFRKLYRYPSVRENPAGPFIYEAYDLDTDPDELVSWADDPTRLPERDALEAELLTLLTPEV